MQLINNEQIKVLQKYSNKPEGIIYSNNSIFLNEAVIDVSIIVPCYNVSKYVSKCVDSLLNQKTDVKYEIILVNDGSIDETLDIINSYKDNKITVINQDNMGMAAARNTGVRISKGKYLLFVDSDDFVSDNYVDILYQKAVSENADIVGTEYKTFESNEKKAKKRISIKNENDIGKMNGCFWGKIFSRSLFNNIYEPEGYWYEDTLVKHILLPMSKKTIVTKGAFYFYRHNNSGLIRSSQKKYRKIETLYITDLIIKSASLFFDNDYIKSQVFFEKIIEQFYINESRVYDLNDDVKKSVFEIQSSFIKKYYANNKIKNNIMLNKYYKCLVKNNYKKSRFFVKYYKLYQIIKMFN